MRLIRLHGIGASIFRFSFARHPRVVTAIERIRSICALGLPLAAARGRSLRGEGSNGYAPIPRPANNLPGPDSSIARSRGMRRVFLPLSLRQSPFERLRCELRDQGETFRHHRSNATRISLDSLLVETRLFGQSLTRIQESLVVSSLACLFLREPDN